MTAAPPPRKGPAELPLPPIRADLHHAADRRRRMRRAAGWSVLGAAVLLLALGAVFLWRLVTADLPRIPPEAQLWSLNRPPGIAFLDKDGRLLGTRGPRHGAPVRLAELPPYLPRAFLAVEDRRFYTHGGVDLPGVARALRRDLAEGRTAEGGSTLTQQLARTLFLGREQTVKRKAQEALLALELERRVPKPRLLELYLNRTYFGAGAYGVEAAAQTYFGRPARELDLPQSALLAALPKAPSRLDPTRDLAAARARAALVLGAMRREGWIGPQAEAQARSHPADLSPENRSEGDFGYVLDLAQAEALAHGGGRPDLVVRLTVDPRLQHAAVEAVHAAVSGARGRGATQGALVALAPDGGIAALVGGLDHRESPFDRATQALRQPGSAFKPFVYAAALAEGAKPDDVRQDSPVEVDGWRPKNFSSGYAGAVTLADALARSINTVAVRLTQEVGADRVAQTARRFGLSTIPPRPGPTVALGAYEVRLLELAGAFQVFQAGGVRRAPHLVESVSDARGTLLWRRTPETVVVQPADQAAAMTAMLEGVVARGTGHDAQIGRPAAGKTGTTQNFRDAWFVGFTPDWTAGVWLGDDRGRPMPGLTGGDAPARAWARFMRRAHEGLPVRAFASQGGDAARAKFYEDLADELELGDQALARPPEDG